MSSGPEKVSAGGYSEAACHFACFCHLRDGWQPTKPIAYSFMS